MCLQGGEWMGGEEPVAPSAIKSNKLLSGSVSAWLHVTLGSLYFILGLIQVCVLVFRPCMCPYMCLIWV